MKERDLTLTLSIVDKKPPSLRTVDYSTEPLCNRLPLKAHLLRVPVFVWRGDQRRLARKAAREQPVNAAVAVVPLSTAT
ncbi:hypothetical protein KUCAC02_004248 [Chaenocephalus aceratus]|uniref:Uncharacterized protein n=1 Tax=Chaenocephalus aceratus TaxID=36190 RepID=A0ACB9WY02_CHAAC|nr:hypothetical protein KUCAC02_004248 [Chaenocephalus aceratus]